MEFLLNFFFPKKCLGCQRLGFYFCRNCQKQISYIFLICPVCQKPSIEGITHPLCQKREELDGLFGLGEYKGLLKLAIHKFKYRLVKDLTRDLVRLVIKRVTEEQNGLWSKILYDNGKDWLIVPVPLHWQRENWRGFNQASALGKELSKKLNLEFQEALYKKKKTSPQVVLSGYERFSNLKGVFEIKKTAILEGKKIILVDDVFTTGSTLKECTRVLKESGASQVWGLTLAR